MFASLDCDENNLKNEEKCKMRGRNNNVREILTFTRLTGGISVKMLLVVRYEAGPLQTSWEILTDRKQEERYNIL